MSIIQTVGFREFQQAFEIRKDNFSYTGLKLLFSMLEDYSNDIGENIELDIIGLCCDFSENSIKDFIYDYSDLTQNFNARETLYISEYLTNYIFYNLEDLTKDSKLVSTYFDMLNNKEYSINNVSNRMDLSLELTDYLIETMESNNFLINICDINNDQDYLKSINNIRLELIENYLNNNSGLYKISQCKTLVVYQNF